jgi:hypothetical protein
MLIHASRGYSAVEVMAATLVTGFGLGFLAMPTLLAVQSSVTWQRRGVATSAVQFFRTIGGTVAVAALGGLLNARLAGLAAGGGRAIDPNAALDPLLRARLTPAALAALTAALAGGLRTVFLALLAVPLVALGVALLFPPGLPRPHPAAADPLGPLDGAAV